MMYDKKEITILNEIVEIIYMTPSFDEMRMTFLEALQMLVHYNQSSFYLASDNKDHILAKPLGVGISDSELQRYIDEYEDKDYTRWIFMSGKSIAYRESDLIADEVRERNEYFREIYLPAHIFYSAQISIAYKGTFLGVISLYRDKETGDFSEKDMALLEFLKDHLENRSGVAAKKKYDGADSIKGRVHFDAYEFMNKYSLTSREVEVLGLLFAGMTNDKICESLVISANTLKRHMSSIYKKLEINNRWELINYI